MSRSQPRFKPPKYKERNAARPLFPTSLSDREIARRVNVTPTSIARWRRAWRDGTDPYPQPASSFGGIADAARRLIES